MKLRFSPSSLSGKTVVNTRAEHQAASLDDLLTVEGAIPVPYPSLTLIPLIDNCDRILPDMAEFDWLIITSQNALTVMDAWSFNRHSDCDLPAKIAVVGIKTANKLAEIFNIGASFIPTTQTSEMLARQIPIQPGNKVLILQSELADPIMADILHERQAIVTVEHIYTMHQGTTGGDVPYLLSKNKIDAVTFTSSSTVLNFVERIMPATAYHLPVACIGETTASTARDAGFQIVLTPPPYNFSQEGMLTVLKDYFRG